MGLEFKDASDLHFLPPSRLIEQSLPVENLLPPPHPKVNSI